MKILLPSVFVSIKAQHFRYRNELKVSVTQDERLQLFSMTVCLCCEIACKWRNITRYYVTIVPFKDARSVSFRSELFTSYILTIFKQ